MDIVTRKQINILIQLASSDKHFSGIEREKILKLASKRNFPESEVKKLIVSPEPIETLGALSMDQRFEYLLSCIDLMLADKKIFDSEILFCRDVAIKLGFKQTVVNFLKDAMAITPNEELKKRVLSEYT